MEYFEPGAGNSLMYGRCNSHILIGLLRWSGSASLYLHICSIPQGTDCSPSFNFHNTLHPRVLLFHLYPNHAVIMLIGHNFFLLYCTIKPQNIPKTRYSPNSISSIRCGLVAQNVVLLCNKATTNQVTRQVRRKSKTYDKIMLHRL